MPSVATASNSCRSANSALRIAPRSSSLSGATTAARRITVARRAAETVRSPRALFESATTRRFPGGIRRFTNFFFTSPSTNREVAGRDRPSQSDTAEREVPGRLWMKARVRNCGTDRSLPRWRRICARINRIAAGTASRISAAQSVGEEAPTVAGCNLCTLPSSDKSTRASSTPAAGQPDLAGPLGRKGAPGRLSSFGDSLPPSDAFTSEGPVAPIVPAARAWRGNESRPRTSSLRVLAPISRRLRRTGASPAAQHHSNQSWRTKGIRAVEDGRGCCSENRDASCYKARERAYRSQSLGRHRMLAQRSTAHNS
jgi:hypothetical protein